MDSSRKTFAGVAVAAVAALSLAACSSSGGGGGGSSAPPNPPGTSTGGGVTTPPSTGSGSGSSQDFSGQSFTILGQWSGGEQKAFKAVLDAFDSQTGAKASYTSAGSDLATVLGTKVAGGNPPDIGILSLPGDIQKYASQNKLTPLSASTQKAVADNYASEWGDLATVNGKAYGVPVDASNKSTIWYNNDLFKNAGISSAPASWDDLIKDGKTLSASGVQVPISVGGGDGWTLTDWFENVYLRTAGVAMYDKLTKHEIKWTDPSVTKALETLKQIWGDPQLIGDPSKAAQVAFTDSVDNVFKKNPSSAIVYEASFVATEISSNTPSKVGVNALVAPFPSVDGSKPVVEAAGDFAVAFTDKPVVQAFLAYLAGQEAAQKLVGTQGSGFISSNKNLPTSAYWDKTSGALGKQIVEVGNNFRFDMSDQAPSEFGGTANQGEWGDLQQFLEDGNVQSAQQALEKDAAAAFK